MKSLGSTHTSMEIFRNFDIRPKHNQFLCHKLNWETKTGTWRFKMSDITCFMLIEVIKLTTYRFRILG